MTVQEAIDMLKKWGDHHRLDVPVYFDCPMCHKSFTPSRVVGETVHIAADKPDPVTKGGA